MKTIYKLVAILIIFSSFLFFSYPTGSPGGKTNSPLDGSNCTECHTSFDLEEVDFWVLSDIPFQGYTPGETYTITATGTHEGAVKIGFELTCENETEKVGTFGLVDEVRTQYTNDNTAVTHTIDGTEPDGDSNTWEVEWTAPEEGMGAVTFYACFNGANGADGSDGDQIYATTLLVNQFGVGIGENSLSEKVSLYPNPATTFVNVNVPDNSNIQVISAAGQQIIELENVSNSTKLDVSTFENGVYFIKVNHEGLSVTKRILKVN